MFKRASTDALRQVLRSVSHAANNMITGESISTESLKNAIESIYPYASGIRLAKFDSMGRDVGLMPTQDQELKRNRQLCRFNGLRCRERDSKAELDVRINRAKNGTCVKSDRREIGGINVPNSFPIRGVELTVNGSKCEMSVHDLVFTTVALNATAFDGTPDALRQARFVETLQALLNGMKTRVCNMCAKTHVRSQAGTMFECGHVYCNQCARYATRHGGKNLLVCPHKSCRDKDKLAAEKEEFRMACHRCPEARPFKSLKEVFLLGCGHAVCEHCKDSMASNIKDNILTCYIGGCGCLLGGRVFRGTELIDDVNAGYRTTQDLGVGGKLEKMAELVKEIQQKSEKVIIFVPYEQQVAPVTTALHKHNIGHKSTLNVKDKDISSMIHDFKVQPSVTALVQVVTGVEASGSNLTCANNVIFVSPLFCLDQEKWDMCRKQAIGRCFRHGQRKNVNVYHLVSENTIEPDILSHHLGKKLLRDPGKDRIEIPPECRAITPDTDANTVLQGVEFGCRYPEAELFYIFRTKDKGDADGEGIF